MSHYSTKQQSYTAKNVTVSVCACQQNKIFVNLVILKSATVHCTVESLEQEYVLGKK